MHEHQPKLTLPSWNEYIRGLVAAERNVLVEACGENLGELYNELRQLFEGRLTDLAKSIEQEREEHRRELDQVKKSFLSLSEIYARTNANFEKQIDLLQQQIDRLAAAATEKRQSDKSNMHRDVSGDLAQIKR